MSQRLAYAAGPKDPPLWEETVGDMMDRVAAEHPDRPALVYCVPGQPEKVWTYAQFVADSRRLALSLLKRFQPGENIAVWSPNSASWVLLQHAAARAGLRLVTVNPAYLSRELDYVLRQSKSVGLFHVDEYRGVDTTAIAQEAGRQIDHLRYVAPLESVGQMIDEQPDGPVPVSVSPGDAVLIQYTSGTTGHPKGVLLNHRGVVNVARFVADRAGMRDGEVAINPMPLFHIGGCGVMELGTFSRAGTFVLLPAYEPGHVLEVLERHRGTMILAVPTMLIGMLEHPDHKTRDLSHLRAVMTGGSLVPVALVGRVKSAFDCKFTITYGQTETSGPATQTSLDDSDVDQAETVGRPLPWMEVKIIDPMTKEDLEFGEQGEICFRGPLLMEAYFDNPTATAETIDPDGWLHSGDLGTMDERGFIRITGRAKEMIIRGGEKIYPREVENVLFEYPGVVDVAVIGLPDEKWGEIVAAVIRTSDGSPLNEDDLVAYCRERLARYKIPVRWYFRSAFPQTPSGKVQKYILQAELSGQNQ
jgi:fatty-acyl-CoA synthase